MTGIQKLTAQFLDQVVKLAGVTLKAQYQTVLEGFLRELQEGAAHWAGKIPAGSSPDGSVSAPSSASTVRTRRVFTREQKLEAVALGKKLGVARAAEQLRVSISSLVYWSQGKYLGKQGVKTGDKERGYTKWTLKQKLEAVKLAKKIGLTAAAKKLGMHPTNIATWAAGRKLGDAGAQRAKNNTHKAHGPETKKKALALAGRVGPTEAARRMGIAESVLRDWRKGKGLGVLGQNVKHPKKAKLRVWTPEEKAKAVELGKEIGVPKAAKQLGAAPAMIRRWRNGKGLGTIGQSGANEARETPPSGQSAG